MVDISYTETIHYFVRFFYDLLIFIIVNIILLNLIFGIIIDAFADLRSKKTEADENIRNYCTICSLESEPFEKHGNGFAHHIEHEHNLWNYIFFVYGLKKKDPTEYTGMESYVADMVLRDDIGWVPIQRALSLKGARNQNENFVEKKLEQLLL